MLFKTYAHQAQGFGLPNDSQTATISNVVTLSKWQQGWRIKHPKAVTELGKFVPHSLITGFVPVIYSVLGAWIGSQRKRPHCACLARHCFAATRSAIVSMSYGLSIMIYTFLITANRGRIADIQRIRTISVSAANEQAARCALSGLSLVFLSRSPAGRLPA